MKKLLAAVLMLALWPVYAQPGPGHAPGPRKQAHREAQRQMPAPERRMSGEERQRLREQVRSGQMTRDEARERWREERTRRGLEPSRSPEERQRLRRDVQEANQDLERR